jgi:hypothetical protein
LERRAPSAARLHTRKACSPAAVSSTSVDTGSTPESASRICGISADAFSPVKGGDDHPVKAGGPLFHALTASQRGGERFEIGAHAFGDPRGRNGELIKVKLFNDLAVASIDKGDNLEAAGHADRVRDLSRLKLSHDLKDLRAGWRRLKASR